MSRIKASSGLMHLVKEMYLYVTNMETVEIPDEFFDKTFIRQLMLGTEEARRENERVKVLHENFAEFLFEGTQYRGDADIYTYGAMKYLTNLKNHFRMNLERFMIRAVFALYRGLSRKGIWAIINGITNDRNYGNEVEFVDNKESNQSTNENSVIRAVIEEHRTVLGLANPTDKISALKKDRERYDRLVLRYFVFLDRELERKAEMKLSEESKEEWERRKAVLMGKHFNVVPMCKIKSHFVTINSRILYGITRDICPEFDVSREDFTGGNRETYWMSIFDFKRLKVSKQKVFTGLIEPDGVAMCVHYRRLKKDRPVPPSAAPVTKHEENKEAGPATQKAQDNDLVVGAAKHEENKEEDAATQEVQANDFVVGAAMHKDEKEEDPAAQKVQDNDLVVGADPGNTNIITIVAPKRTEDGADGNLRQKDMRLF